MNEKFQKIIEKSIAVILLVLVLIVGGLILVLTQKNNNILGNVFTKTLNISSQKKLVNEYTDEIKKDDGYENYIKRGEAYFEVGDYNNAEKDYLIAEKKIMEISNNWVSADRYILFYDMGLLYNQRKEFSKAEEKLLEAINYSTSESDKAIVYTSIGVSYLGRENLKEAEDIFVKSIETWDKDNSSYNAHLNLGKIYEKQRKIAKAEEEYRKSFNKKRDYEEIYIVLSDFLIKNSRIDEAANLLKGRDLGLKSSSVLLKKLKEVEELQGGKILW